MKLVSWNVNGLRACLTHGFAESFAALDADVFCLQETKMQPGQADFHPEGYEEYFYSAEKKGYSGTACYCKVKPMSVALGVGAGEHDREGRVITLEYPGFYLVNCYTPNSQEELRRLDYRMAWEDMFRAYLLKLDAQKPVILCGDLNVAHQEIDIKNPDSNRRSAGFTDEERDRPAGGGLCRQLPPAAPRRGQVQLVELPLPRPRPERRVADRLLSGLKADRGQGAGCRDPQRGDGFRSLPGGTGHRLGRVNIQ